MTINQSMDIGADPTMFASGPDQYLQNYMSSHEKPQHYRSGSHAVGANMKNQQKMLIQASSINQDVQERPIQSRGSGTSDRVKNKKRKHNMSQNLQFEYNGSLANLGGNNTMGAPKVGVISKLQAPESKRSYENTQNFEKKGTRQLKQKFVNVNPNQGQYIQNSQSQGSNLYETTRYNSISSLQNPGNGSSSKERYHVTQKMGKNTMKVGQGGSIILPANPAGVPQLKSQLQNKQIPVTHSQQLFVQNNQHQRGHSVQNDIQANMQRGFNSASNAAMQQQQQIVQIYQQQSAPNNQPQSKKSGYQGNNSRKVIPVLQGQPQVTQHKRGQNHQNLSRDRDANALQGQSQKQLIGDTYQSSNYQTYNQNYSSSQGQINPMPVRKSNDTSRANRREFQNGPQAIPQKQKGSKGQFNQTSAQSFFEQKQSQQAQFTPQMTQSLKHTLQSNPQHIRQTSVQVGYDQNKKMSVQHRKNKSVLSNQIRINPALNQQKMRGSQQYLDNYTDQMQQNYYMQQMHMTKASNLNLTQAPHQLQNSNTSLTNASLKHNLSQSSHRKNKTAVIGSGGSKMLGINSSSVFPAGPSLIAMSGNQSTTKKKQGGTISHSQKSLRSQSSSRKRVISMDTAAMDKSAPKVIKNISSGHLTPDLSQYAGGNISGNHHQQQKNLRAQLKNQGNIVIQPSTHQANLESSKGNRRHSSILKGEHQNKQMIFIENKKKKQDQLSQQDSVGSATSVRVGFQDGGTGGGIQKQRFEDSKTGFYSSSKEKDRMRDSSTEDYNERGHLPPKGGVAMRRDPLADIDVLDVQINKKRGNKQADPPRSKSLNITEEALAIGKIPPEDISNLIADQGHTLQATDRKLSPRTREMVGLSNIIRKSFLQKGDAPKTVPSFYRAGKMLGRGAFGKVSMGMHKLSRKLVALKCINKEFMTDDKQKSKVMHEVGILLRLRHQSVVKLYETFETKRHMLLSMELCAGGDLLNYVRKRKKLDEDVAKVVFTQIIEGLGYIHKKRILHRDIKLDNILLDGKGNVKIADFGVSKLVKPGEVMHEQSGTPAYIAPEILKEDGYMGFKADIWSAGVVLYAMLCGTVPFKAGNMKELHKMIIKGKYVLKEEVTPEAKALLKLMLETDPKKRISISKILQHPWMQLPDDPVPVFNQEEKDIVKKEFIYNNPKMPNRSEKINKDDEPWDCFTELNLDSIDQEMRNESEKSVILAPFNSSISDFNEDDWKGMDASLIIHRLFDDTTPLQDKKETVRFAARCRDQDRQYEINNNGELDNGVYHKFVYSSRDGNPEPSSSIDDAKGSVDGLRPHSSRNMNKPSGGNIFGEELKQRLDTDNIDDIDLDQESSDSIAGLFPGHQIDNKTVQTLVNFGYNEDYVRQCIMDNVANYCNAAYILYNLDQNY